MLEQRWGKGSELSKRDVVDLWDAAKLEARLKGNSVSFKVDYGGATYGGSYIQ